MKILALSDVHGDKTLIKEMAERGAKEKVDLVLLAGDLVNHEGSVEGIVGPFKAKGLEVAVLPGNHEGMSEIGFLVDKYGAKNLHGYVFKKGDVGIFGCGYADIGIHQLQEEDFLKTLRKAHDNLGSIKKKVLVTHIHPSKSIFGLGLFEGSTGVQKALDELKPDIHICGHMHETEGIEETIGKTKVFNVGRTGKIIEI